LFLGLLVSIIINSARESVVGHWCPLSPSRSSATSTWSPQVRVGVSLLLGLSTWARSAVQNLLQAAVLAGVDGPGRMSTMTTGRLHLPPRLFLAILPALYHCNNPLKKLRRW